MKISLCLTTYNRPEMCIESFEEVVNDPRIDDIVIMDDSSTGKNHYDLCSHFMGHPKVRIKMQANNRGMAVNKKDAISWSANGWCIILDDDNRIGTDYLDALETTPGLFDDPSEIYLPDFAKPNFNYQAYGGLGFCAKNIREVCTMPMFGALMNTCNYVVNRDFYWQAWRHNPEMKATDTIWHALQHLKAGGGFYVVPGMEYEHRVHPESGFAKDMDYNMAKAMDLERQIKSL